MTKTIHIVQASSRAGKMFRSITGDYEAATPIRSGVWQVAHIAIQTANRHSVKELLSFRQTGRQTVSEVLAISVPAA